MHDEIIALDLHPSGMFVIVSYNSHLQYYNVLPNKLKPYYGDQEVKGSKEIKFSNGGHLFACNQLESVLVFKFFSAVLAYKFTHHKTIVRALAWLDDDSGLSSAGTDYQICFWKLSNLKEANLDPVLIY